MRPDRLGPPHPRPHGGLCQGAREPGLKVIIAGAGGAAHLPGMVVSMTTLPVLGVPVEAEALKGMDSLLSIVQMPGGVPVATFAIGEAGAKNAALHAAAILALSDAGAGKAAGRPGARKQTRRRVRRKTVRQMKTLEQAARAAGRHDRHYRRRPAGPHAGAWRRRGWG